MASSKCNPRDFWPLRHLIRVMRVHDMTKKRQWQRQIQRQWQRQIHKEHLQRAILVTCDIWDTDYIPDNWEPEFMTIFVTWQLRVTRDSIRNSCDVYIYLGLMVVFLFCFIVLQKASKEKDFFSLCFKTFSKSLFFSFAQLEQNNWHCRSKWCQIRNSFLSIVFEIVFNLFAVNWLQAIGKAWDWSKMPLHQEVSGSGSANNGLWLNCHPEKNCKLNISHFKAVMKCFGYESETL